MGLPLRKADRKYTYRDYRSWPEDERWELIEGAAWNMSPAPNRFHQQVSFRLARDIGIYLRGKGCEAYSAPFDVFLPETGETEEDDVSTVVQPDIAVICDPEKLTEKGCLGAPDWIVEIISPRTASKDFKEKLHLYERHGVQEYWIVDPGNKFIHVYLLDPGTNRYGEPLIFVKGGIDEKASCHVCKGLIIDTAELFD